MLRWVLYGNGPLTWALRLKPSFQTHSGKIDSKTMLAWGLANRVFPDATFRDDVAAFWHDHLNRNNHRSILESKKLIASPKREAWLGAAVRASSALADSFVRGDPIVAFEAKRKLLESKKKGKL